MRLSHVVGHAMPLSLITGALSRDRLPHAYLFDGPDGVGKKTVALALGQALVCARRGDAGGCGQCDPCLKAEAGHHPDIRIFEPTGASINVATAKEIVALGSRRPHEAPARTIVIDAADTLNANAANALLKTLEEPAPGNHFVLVTSAPERLLTTIRSRTQRVRFGRLKPDEVVGFLLSRGVEKARAELAAAMSDGRVDRALTLCQDDEEDSPLDTASAMRNAAAGGRIGDVMDTAATFSGKEQRARLKAGMQMLQRFYRDTLVSAAGAPDLVVLRESEKDIDGLAAFCRTHHNMVPLRKILWALGEAENDLAANVNAVTAAEALLLRMRNLERSARKSAQNKG